MSDSAAAKAYEVWKAVEGKEEATGEWMEVTQERINQFADVTEDHQFIHVDVEAAKATPFGTTIAHGFLTLSMLTHLEALTPSVSDPRRFAGIVMGINYGFDKVRFPSPVPVGSRIRVHRLLSRVTLKGASVEMMRTMTVQVEGSERPAVAAEWITRLMFAS
ncbi:MAG: MaoC family dehydratase [bacterium]